jgi:hypothetical protein
MTWPHTHGGVLRLTSGVVVFSPDRADEAYQRAVELSAPRVAFMPVTSSVGWMVADGAYDYVSISADAYASSEETLSTAIELAAREVCEDRVRGPLRLTYLGSLGELSPRGPILGASVRVGDPVFIGRAPDATISLRQGHSDQSTVARRHARVERTARGTSVTDLQSTNGTWVNGKRVAAVDLAVGDEIAIACTHRFRLDGVAPSERYAAASMDVRGYAMLRRRS